MSEASDIDPPSAGTEGSVTLQDAAEQLGVHYMTAYRYVRTGRLAAHKRAGKWWIDPSDLMALTAQPATSPGQGSRSGKPNLESYITRLQQRLVVGDDAGAWLVINEALASGASAPDVHNGVISPAMVRIGEAWAAGELTIAAEHRASSTLTRVLGRMASLFRHPGRRKCTVVLGSVAGDSHTLPTAVLADLLCDAGYEVIDMGANTPASSFLEVAVGIDGPVIIGLCCSIEEAQDSLTETAGVIRAALPDVAVFVGGRAAATIADDLPVDGHAATGQGAVELFDAYLAG